MLDFLINMAAGAIGAGAALIVAGGVARYSIARHRVLTELREIREIRYKIVPHSFDLRN